MREAWELFLGFFLANVFGYGGGPASIPLMYEEVVTNRGWLTSAEFTNVLALGNSLPGPIATKIAAYVGYDVAGWFGVAVALAATVAPSAAALILLLRLLHRYKQSPVVKGMTLLVQPVIAVMMAIVTWDSSAASIRAIGILQYTAIAAVAFYLLQRRRVHPAFVIVGAFVYGGLFLSE
ncbi:chromate transporter [Paenibacillus sp.]|uniref:chromate transporter n=1 Tax=Paenibacillus sp. TaxID=58172 RepID=UPI002D42C5B8|nr:chromate transporter [Paenibacillus sp.]HZG57997.1 chromate transporter [Paenibacillus sp.]